ncbi:MAG: hypothetical protein K2P81_09380 [Bacteriovoracaceae bacterium]|nr:hypothetical protein [Bacteriovoracaceae bacterium]
MRTLIVPALLLATVSSAYAAKWDKTNDPNKFARVTGKAFTAKFSSLPLKAKLSNPHFIWSDTFWPANLGGIAYRWNNEPNPEIFKYKMYSKAEIEKMDVTELEKLSPTEKYDIFMGDYKYSLTKKVLGQNKPTDLWWEGICHGWSIAAVNHPEPARVNVENKDGITVPFGSSDVKGLLDYYYAEVHKTKTYARIGARCGADGKVPGEAYPEDRVQTPPKPSQANAPECSDVNAGAFHMALANMIGLQDRGFVADVDRFNDVWNQPVGEYSSQIMDERLPTPQEAAIGAARIVRIKMDMTYGEELNLLRPEDAKEEGGFMSMDPVTTTPEQTFTTRYYEYNLEIDAAGNVIGGSWISETRPDFMWIKGKAETFEGRLSGLNKIYKPFVN